MQVLVEIPWCYVMNSRLARSSLTGAVDLSSSEYNTSLTGKGIMDPSGMSTDSTIALSKSAIFALLGWRGHHLTVPIWIYE
jgi:hypothetical protein